MGNYGLGGVPARSLGNKELYPEQVGAALSCQPPPEPIGAFRPTSDGGKDNAHGPPPALDPERGSCRRSPSCKGDEVSGDKRDPIYTKAARQN